MAAKPKAVFFSLVFLFITLPILADVLVLKNGKKLEGTLVKQDDEVYLLQDPMGIIITVKKSQVDVDATEKLNAEQKKLEAALPKETKSESKPENTTVADLARAARANRTGTARTLRKEDLEKTPELSIIGTTQSEESIEDHAPLPADHLSEKNEEYWRSQTRQFANDLRRVRDDVELLGKECDDLNKQAAYAIVDPSQYMIINGVLVPISGSGYDSTTIQRAQEVCFQSEQAKKELARIEKELQEFQEDARRKGALPGWIDPDRI